MLNKIKVQNFNPTLFKAVERINTSFTQKCKADRKVIFRIGSGINSNIPPRDSSKGFIICDKPETVICTLEENQIIRQIIERNPNIVMCRALLNKNGAIEIIEFMSYLGVGDYFFSNQIILSPVDGDQGIEYQIHWSIPNIINDKIIDRDIISVGAYDIGQLDSNGLDQAACLTEDNQDFVDKACESFADLELKAFLQIAGIESVDFVGHNTRSMSSFDALQALKHKLLH